MRIVGGTCGGRVLKAPAGAATRPTSEKVREALFGILGRLLGSIEGDHVLDLFAGSGAVGIEALSRGAGHATFVDSAKSALLAVRSNLATLGLADRATVVPGDSLTTAARHVPPTPFRFVFIDPPYASDLAVRGALALPRAQLTADAIVAIEHDRRHVPPDALGALRQADQRRYGDTLLSFFTLAPPP